MSKYGIGIYGVDTTRYGDKEAGRTYYASNINALSYGYNSVALVWNSIVPDPADVDRGYSPTHWRLIKSFSGTPDNPIEGTLVYGSTFVPVDNVGGFKNSWVDENISIVDAQVVYSLWVFNGESWINCGEVSTIIVQETETTSLISKWIPKAWLNYSNGFGDATGEVEDNDLYKVLKAYSLIYDRLRAEAKILQQSSSQQQIHNSLLRANLDQLGFGYEPSLGDSYHRSLYKAGNTINALKGTAKSISAYVTGLTHLGNEIVIGHNELLDYNDSSFEESTGHWGVDLGTLVQHTYSGTDSGSAYGDLGVTVNTPVIPLYDPLSPPRMAGFVSLSMPQAPNVANPTPQVSTLSLPAVGLSLTNYGVPVKPKTRYLFSGWVKHLDNSATVAAYITWYTSIGNVISTSATPTTLTTTTSWAEFTSKSDLGRNGVLSPDNAVYATIRVVVTPTTLLASTCLFDLFQLSDASKSLEFEDARKVRVYLRGERENFLHNPDFEEGSGGWIASDNGSFAQDPTVYNTSIYHGSCLGELTVVTPGLAYVSSDWFVVEPGQNYTFSGWISSHYPNIGHVKARIEFSNRESVDKQTQILNDADGYYYENTAYYVDSEPVLLSAHTVLDENGNVIVDAFEPGQPPQYVPTKVNISVTGIAPQYTRDSGMPMAKVSVVLVDGADAEPSWTCYMDGFSVQAATTVVPFFSGNGAPAPVDPVNDLFFPAGDTFWETKNIINLIQNPSFETTDNWTAGSGTTLTTDTGGMAAVRAVLPNGTLENAIGPEPYGPKFGSNIGKVSYTPAVGGSISTTVYLPSPAVGGEDFVVSASVRAAEGIYVISTSGNGASSSNRIEVYQHDQYQWIRIAAVRQLVPGETSFTVTLGITPPPPFFPGGPAGYTIGPTSFFHVDGFQAEYGRIPNGFLDPALPSTHTVDNPGNPSTVMYVGQTQSKNGGKSSFIYNYGVKTARLRDSLSLIMPIGSSWCIKPGIPTEEYPELIESLIPSASFEKDLGSWVGTNASLSRVISRGSLFEEFVTHGAAYALVTSSGTNNATKSFGISTGHVSVLPGRGYYASVAIRPVNSDSLGSYTLRVDFYSASGGLIPVYKTVDNAQVLATDEYRSVTVSITHTDRWAYIAKVLPAFTTLTAAYAILTVTYNPTSYVAGQAFHIDRAVFRE